MNIHFIAIGGSAMHNLAIALHRKGYAVTGSDDEIFEPSKSRLAALGLDPLSLGWDADRIHNGLDAVILGMHARADNPELLRATELGLKIYSYPEYIYEQTADKTRAVIGGSHGKTTVTSMILHVLTHTGRLHDYMAGAQLPGYDCMVRLCDEAPVAVLEGDEYLSSPIDRRPKFHLYKPHIALITGIAWDHINVFPTFENYVEQFREFIRLIEPSGTLIYFDGDPVLQALAAEFTGTFALVPYSAHASVIRNGRTYLMTDAGEVVLKIFGDHNLQNLAGAMEVCRKLGVAVSDFYEAIATFGGAGKRLERVSEGKFALVLKDFAHAPSKLKATTEAVRTQFPERRLVACMELHTFSSLSDQFLDHYAGCMDAADEALVYYSPAVVAHKRLPVLSPERVAKAFTGDNVSVFTDSSQMLSHLQALQPMGGNLLLMSSGNFDGLEFGEVGEMWVGAEG